MSLKYSPYVCEEALCFRLYDITLQKVGVRPPVSAEITPMILVSTICLVCHQHYSESCGRHFARMDTPSGTGQSVGWILGHVLSGFLR